LGLKGVTADVSGEAADRVGDTLANLIASITLALLIGGAQTAVTGYRTFRKSPELLVADLRSPRAPNGLI
jgi:hypothetical protein